MPYGLKPDKKTYTVVHINRQKLTDVIINISGANLMNKKNLMHCCSLYLSTDTKWWLKEITVSKLFILPLHADMVMKL